MAAELAIFADPNVTLLVRLIAFFIRRLFLKLALDHLDLFGERPVIADQTFDLADGVQDGGVVTPAEAPPDLRQRAQGQGLGKIHRDLARAHHIGGAPRGKEIAAADIVAARDDPLDFVDLDLAPCGRIRSRISRSASSSVIDWPVSLLTASSRFSAPSRSRPLLATDLAI